MQFDLNNISKQHWWDTGAGIPQKHNYICEIVLHCETSREKNKFQKKIYTNIYLFYTE